MDQKAIAGTFAAAVTGILTWLANTTLDLKKTLQRLEMILLDDAMTK